MTLDIQEAAQTLQKSLELLNEVKAVTAVQQAEFIAQMYTTTHLLFSHPIIGAVTAEATAEFDQKHANALAMVWGAATEGRRLASVLNERLKVLGSRVPQDAHPNAMAALTSLTRRITLGSESVDVVQLFQRMSESAFIGDATVLSATKDAIDSAKEFLANAKDWFGAEDVSAGFETMTILNEFQMQVQKTQHNAESLRAVVEAISLRNATARLKSFDQWVSSVVRGLPPSNSTFEIPDKAALRSQLLLPLQVLAARVLEKLAAEAPVAHVLRRMKVHFEHFAREETVEEVKGASRIEDKLQLKMDRFLFDNGVFPITHINVARGFADTLFSEVAPKIRVANENTIPPVLIELKQAMSFNIDVSIRDVDVRSKISEGRLQARTYADHIATNIKWSRPRVHVVVFYNGPQRYHVDADDILLVYLGERRPSEGSVVLDLSS
ncbi:hypothetical protein F0U62_38685 [Cystobacter fuscus]|uniref:hypothetical protein n=1 Tax=Cystobacter fuscus TaxID=43 RepID=UPI002B29F9B6|nr:hypothetical protein F0U62_38685 [Cystobacter fuscus]